MPVSDVPAATGDRIQLPDGRWLGYAEHGDPAGKPVFFFHGAPSSRLFRHPDESIAASLDARVITVDRPGFGLSDFQPERTLLDWPDDVAALADALGLERFAVGGISAGGPYVAACAYKIPHRLTSAGIVSGVGPTDCPGVTEEMPRPRRIGVAVARRAPWLLIPLLWLFNNPRRDPERFFEQIKTQVSDPDRAVLARPEVRAVLVASYAETARPGLRGFAWESLLLSHPWGFRLEDITMEVHLWHGEDDASIPVSMGRTMAGAIPNCRATFLPGEGHFLFFDHWGEILSALL